MKLSNRWLWRFKKHNKFKHYNSHCESRDVDLAQVELQMPLIRGELKKYSLNDYGMLINLVYSTNLLPNQQLDPVEYLIRERIMKESPL